MKNPRILTVLATLLAEGIIAQAQGGHWSPLGAGVDLTVWGLAVSGSNLYAGGSFMNAGGQPANSIAQWNGSNWSPLGSGMNNTVYALAVSGGVLYVGGNFTTAGGVTAKYIAQWNGTNWSALGSGMSGDVNALAVSDGTLYAAGSFRTAGGQTVNSIARWNGSSWSGLGTGVEVGDAMAPTISALAVSGALYAGGNLSAAGGLAANCIARWNGSAWSPLGSGITGGGNLGGDFYVDALALSGSTLYAGGNFLTAGSATAHYIAQWNGSSWSPLGSGMNANVIALAASGGALYAGGDFTTAGGIAGNYIAQWNGSSWSPLGSGISGYAVFALAVSGNTLYAAGNFTNAGGIAVNNIAQWNLPCMALECPDNIVAATSSNTAVVTYAVNVTDPCSTNYTLVSEPPSGAAFPLGATTVTNTVTDNLGNSDSCTFTVTVAPKFNTWLPLGSGLNGIVYALAASGTNLYAGGDFTTAGGIAANYIAQWDGTNWSPLSSGMAGGDAYGTKVLTLAVSGGALYAGGDFTTAGGQAASYAAKWNGSNWSALGNGVNQDVLALAASGANLYAGGFFTTAGGNSVSYVARWNGSSWSPLGSGLGPPRTAGYYPVFGMAASGDALYVGGNFTTAGGHPATNIAQWNGASWSPVGPGLPGNYVYALAPSNGALYAGGDFTNAADKEANYLAQWNGSAWSPVASGVIGQVFAFAVSGSALYVGGDFLTADGNATNVAQWDGSSWSPLGALNGAVGAFALSGSTLYAGGKFTTADGNTVNYIAQRTVVTPPPLSINTTNGQFGFSNHQFQFTMTGPAGATAVIQASADLQTWTPVLTNPLNLGSLTFTDTLATNHPLRFYRAQLAQ